MPRLNIYVPDELAREIESFRDQINLSQICAAALRDELSARYTLRHPDGLLSTLFIRNAVVEPQLGRKFGLRRLIAGEATGGPEQLRETITQMTAAFLDGVLFGEMQLAIGGGTQMWDVVRRLKARGLRLEISAIGYGHTDPRVPHVHPNMLATLLSLLYAPKSRAVLVASAELQGAWSAASPIRDEQHRVILGSCAPFDVASAYGRLFDKETTELLVEERVVGEFLGCFFTADERVLEPYLLTSPVSHISAADLREHAKRSDTIVALAAAGAGKLDLIRQVLDAKLCNTLITDDWTAAALTRRSAYAE